jgi:predicted DCC family thiol-disulfide oxidoreductase YuxK
MGSEDQLLRIRAMGELSEHPVVLFDGVCNLCNGFVQFIMKRDANRVFRFASLQSEVGQSLLEVAGRPKELSTIVLIERGRSYDRSTAALRIARHLRFPWPFFFVLLIAPRFLRDAIYSWVGRNRYRWFGKSDMCAVPTAANRALFLDQQSL